MIRPTRLPIIIMAVAVSLQSWTSACEPQNTIDEAVRWLGSEEDGLILEGLRAIALLRAEDPGLLPHITPLLNHESAGVREFAVEAAFAHGADLERLQPLLEDEHSDVVVAVISGLIEKREAPPTDFTELLTSQQPSIRAAVAERLLEAGIEHRHVEALRRDNGTHVRARVAAAMLKAGADWRDFVDMLKDPSSVVRGWVGDEMESVGADVEVLLPLLEDEAPEIRSSMAYSLLMSRRADIAVCLRVITESEPEFEEALYKSVGPKTREALAPVYIEWLSGPTGDRRDRAKAALMLFESIPVSCLPDIERLLQHRLGSVRALGVSLIANVKKDERSRAMLRRCVRDGDARVQLAAIESAQAGGYQELLPELRELTESPSTFVRIAAAGAIAKRDESDMQCLRVLAAEWDALHPTVAERVEEALALTGERAASNPELLWKVFTAPQWPGFASVLGIDEWDPWADPDPAYAVPQEIVYALGQKATTVLNDWATRPNLPADQKEALIFLAKGHEESVDGLSKIVTELAWDMDSGKRFWDYSLIAAGFEILGEHHPAQLGQFMTGAKNAKIRRLAIRAAETTAESEKLLSESLAKVLQGDNRDEQYVAAYLLLEHPGLVEFLKGLLDNEYDSLDQDDQRKWISLISRLKAPAAQSLRDPLLRVLKRGTNSTEWTVLKLIGENPVPEIVKQLDHAVAKIRGQAIRALGEIDPNVARKHIIRMMKDKPRIVGGYYSDEVRADALDTVEAVGVDTSMLPVFIEMLKDEFQVFQIARYLEQLGPEAKPALSHLMRACGDEYGLFVAQSVAAIVPDSPLGLIPLRKELERMTPGRSWSYFVETDFMELAADLGERARPLIPRLRYLVIEEELLHPEVRIAAAAALAQLEPGNPSWRRYVEEHDDTYQVWVHYLKERRKQQSKSEGAKPGSSDKQ